MKQICVYEICKSLHVVFIYILLNIFGIGPVQVLQQAAAAIGGCK